MKRLAPLLAAASLGYAVPAGAQAMNHSMPGMNMPGMQTPAKPKPATERKTPPKKKPAAKAETTRPSAAAAHNPTKPAANSQTGHDMNCMPGMETPKAEAPPAPGHDMSAMPATQAGQHTGQDMSMPGMDMSGMQQAGPKSGTDLPAGNAPPPPLPMDNAADRAFPPATMAAARKEFAM